MGDLVIVGILLAVAALGRLGAAVAEVQAAAWTEARKHRARRRLFNRRVTRALADCDRSRVRTA